IRDLIVTGVQTCALPISLWVSDHIVIPTTTDADYPGGGRRFPIPPETPYLEPVAMLSALAMVTTKARIGCSVFILGHRHPVAMEIGRASCRERVEVVAVG